MGLALKGKEDLGKLVFELMLLEWLEIQDQDYNSCIIMYLLLLTCMFLGI